MKCVECVVDLEQMSKSLCREKGDIMTIVKDEVRVVTKGIQYKVVEDIADLGTEERYNTRLKERIEYTWKLRRVSFNGKPAKYDLRPWAEIEGNEVMDKGIQIPSAVLVALKDALTAEPTKKGRGKRK